MGGKLSGSERRRSLDTPISLSNDLRLVLVGKTGSGKSSSGNTILGQDLFNTGASNSSVTQQCCKHSMQVCSHELSVVDTPGLLDTTLPEPAMKREISKCINMSAPGPHAILLVIKVGPFKGEEEEAVRQVEEMFGPDAWRYTIILFTHGDRVQVEFNQLLEEAGPELQSVLRKAGNRYHLFNNKRTNERGQVLDLLEKVDQMVKYNDREFYSNNTYQRVVEMLDLREAELRKFYQEKCDEELKALTSKYEEKLRETQVEAGQVEERLQRELQELKRYYKVLEHRVRQVLEQAVETDSMDEIKKFCETLRLN